ncbi:MAG: hypothetical protein J6B68_10955 [Lachnospiraceae bacterium]|nr:hypothetical protein [Lachnospiraceae bacterium]
MKGFKIAPVAGVISIILGIIGIATGIYIIGTIFGTIGVIFGLISYADTKNTVLSYIGIFLSMAAVAWTCIFYYLWAVIG